MNPGGFPIDTSDSLLATRRFPLAQRKRNGTATGLLPLVHLRSSNLLRNPHLGSRRETLGMRHPMLLVTANKQAIIGLVTQFGGRQDSEAAKKEGA